MNGPELIARLSEFAENTSEYPPWRQCSSDAIAEIKRIAAKAYAAAAAAGKERERCNELQARLDRCEEQLRFYTVGSREIRISIDAYEKRIKELEGKLSALSKTFCPRCGLVFSPKPHDPMIGAALVVERRSPICGAPDPIGAGRKCGLENGHQGDHMYLV